MIVGQLVLPLVQNGMSEASTTRNLPTPCTRLRGEMGIANGGVDSTTG